MSATASVCWHCGEPLPANDVIHAHIAGESRPLCCKGCCAAAEWIEQLGLGDYYRLRSQPARKPDPETTRESSSRDAWQRPQIAAYVTRDAGPGLLETNLLIDGVRCSGCVWLIDRALSSLPGVVSVRVNAVSQRARVIWRKEKTTLSGILEQLERTGYRAFPLEAHTLDDVRRRDARDALKRLLVAGFGTMQAMMCAAVLYLIDPRSPEPATIELFRWLGFLVATPVVFYSARPFFVGALRSIRARRLSMDIPVAAAVALIYAASLFEALRGTGEVYFDSVSMFVFFLLTGRYLEMRARHHAGDLTDALARLTPPFAERRRDDGMLERVGVHELSVGDRVHVAEGGAIPADGALLTECCRVDESLMSGESAPVLRRHGDSLLAGCILLDGPVDMQVERVGEQTALAGIAALACRAHTERPALTRAGERATAQFVGRVLALTALTAVVWSFLDPSRAFGAALAVLVVSCPCAFALAVPAAITRALAVLARHGVLVVKPDAMEALAGAHHVVLDKTGTLTEPRLALADIRTVGSVTQDFALRIAASLGQESRHPVARAIVAAHAGASTETVSDVQVCTGFGISGRVAGRGLRLGRHSFALPESRFDDTEGAAVWLADDQGALCSFRLTEGLRPGTRSAIDALHAQGLELHIASGDSPARVKEVAAQLGIPDWRARQLPVDKLQWMGTLRAKGAAVVAVGDGVNDAPILAGADVAVALAGGAQIAQASADIVLAGERLEALAIARTIAQQTLAILKQNQRWAMLYNLSAVPLAALGFVPPWLAALGMSLSSLVVTLNALRIGHVPVRTASTSTHTVLAHGAGESA